MQRVTEAPPNLPLAGQSGKGRQKQWGAGWLVGGGTSVELGQLNAVHKLSVGSGGLPSLTLLYNWSPVECCILPRFGLTPDQC